MVILRHGRNAFFILLHLGQNSMALQTFFYALKFRQTYKGGLA